MGERVCQIRNRVGECILLLELSEVAIVLVIPEGLRITLRSGHVADYRFSPEEARSLMTALANQALETSS